MVNPRKKKNRRKLGICNILVQAFSSGNPSVDLIAPIYLPLAYVYIEGEGREEKSPRILSHDNFDDGLDTPTGKLQVENNEV